MRSLRYLPYATAMVVLSGSLALAQTVEVTASALNLRTGPSSSNSVIAVAPRGARMTLLATNGSWAQVSYNGRTGWAYSTYLRAVQTGSTTAVTRYVTASGLNVRTSPSTSATAIGQLSRGQAVRVTGTTGDWAQIDFNGRAAYVHAGYLSASSQGGTTTGGTTTGGTTAQTRYVTANGLNVRSGPGTNYRQLGSLSYGASVSVTGTSGVWAQISYNGSSAYVHGSYLSTSQPSTGGGSGGSNGYASSPNRSRAGFIQLANSGPGFFGYYASSKRWGLPAMVYGIERAARRFKAENPTAPRLGVGDISLMNGGDISGHASHERGVDADFRPIRNNSTEGPTTIFQSVYSRTRTQRILDLLRSEMRVQTIFFNDSRVRGVQRWPNHDNHFHVRIYR